VRTDSKLFLSATAAYVLHEFLSAVLYGFAPFILITLAPYLLLLAFWNKAPRLVRAVLCLLLVLLELNIVRDEVIPHFQQKGLGLEALHGLLLLVCMALLVVTAVVLIREYLASRKQRSVSA